MTRRKRILLLVLLLVLIPGAVGVWVWRTWPAKPIDEARRAFEAGDLDRAENLLRPLLRERGADPAVPFLYARVLRKLKRHDQAELALQTAVDRGLDARVARRELALLMAEQELPREAEGILQQVLRDYPDDVEVLQTLAHGFLNHQRWLDAEPLLARLVELQPHEIDFLYLRGRARMGATHFSEAADDFRRVLAASPEHFHARLYLAHCLLSDARMADAEAELLACHELRPDRPEPLVGLASCAIENADLKTAEERLNQALALDRSSPLVLREVANLHLRRGRYDLAGEVLEVLARAHPDDKQAHLQLAQVYRRKGDIQAAGRHEQKYRELDRAEESRSRGMR